MASPGRYLYAIGDAAGVRDAVGAKGIDGAVTYSVAQNGVAAVLSDLGDKRIRPERAKLAAHHEVVKRLMERTTILPVAFGTIAAGPETVRRILSENQDAFAEQLQRVRGRVEMGLRVVWDVPNIFACFVGRYPELAALRDAGVAKRQTQDEKIELGRLFDRLLGEEREEHAATVLGVLEAGYCVEAKSLPPKQEREVLRFACLVERDAQKKFEDGVLAAARRFDNSFSFDFNGPWAPANFVDLAIEV